MNSVVHADEALKTLISASKRLRSPLLQAYFGMKATRKDVEKICRCADVVKQQKKRVRSELGSSPAGSPPAASPRASTSGSKKGGGDSRRAYAVMKKSHPEYTREQIQAELELLTQQATQAEKAQLDVVDTDL